jgi:hypothetical protein
VLQQRALFEKLPDEVVVQVPAFLPQWDLGAVLQLSKRIRRITLPTIHTLELGEREGYNARARAAFFRLMKLTTDLWRLSFHKDDELDVGMYNAFREELVEALGDGSVGGQLHTFSLPWGEARDLIENLEAGCLPLLQELQVPALKSEAGPALAAALEARRALCLPPLTHLETNLTHCDAGILCRIWACCPPDQVTHLEAAAGYFWPKTRACRLWDSTCTSTLPFPRSSRSRSAAATTLRARRTSTASWTRWPKSALLHSRR